jgi:tetratricopeptide (TPR) repeat protein
MARESSPEASPEAARKLFDAKLPAPKSNRNLAIAVTLLALIAGIGIGGYIWWEMQPKSSLVAASPAPAPVATTPIQPPSPPAPPAPQTPQAPVAAAAALPPLAVVPVAVPPAPTIATAAAQPADDSEDEPPKAAAPKPRPPAPAVATADFPVRVQTAPKKVDPAIEQAYLAFNRGDTEQAQAAWKKALARDPRNTDALHGMAALALRDKQHDLAANYYLRALENNPRDALALSGLMALKAPTDMLQAESRLKLLLAEQPDSPHLNFALGNLYTRNQRWAEAQQSFFRAHTADPANPDYLFNLAVSLDQLHQPRLAVQHYGKALEAAAQQPAGFDADQVAVRIKALQSLPSRQP